MQSSPLRNGLVDSPSPQLRTSARRTGSSPGSRLSMDSPSRQLMDEFTRMLVDGDRSFKEQLDRADAEQARKHREALQAAAREHERVRQSAQRLRERIDLEIQREHRRRELEEKAEIERIRTEKQIQDHQRQLDELARLEEEQRLTRERTIALAEAEARLKAENERHAAESRKRQDTAEAEAKLQVARIERERELKLQENLQAQEQAKKTALQLQAPSTTFAGITPAPHTASPAATTTKTLSSSSSSSSSQQSPLCVPLQQLDSEHARYLQLHKKLKTMRSYMKEQKKLVPAIQRMEDMRRETRKLLGQLTMETQANLAIRKKVRALLAEARSMTQVMVDAREFIIHPSAPIPPGADTNVPGVFIYLLNMLAKQGIRQMGSSAGITTYNAIDPIGVLLIAMFSASDFRWHGNSFIDILLAKYHLVCPVLFGIYGPENTAQGKARIGWAREDGGWLPRQAHYDRLAGIGAGWASLTLRNFSRSNEKNALPAWNYWRSMACIINVPPAQATATHFVVLKGMIEQYAQNFVKFYGQAAVVALRKAVITFPSSAQKSSESEGVMVLRDRLRNKIQLTL